MTDRTKEALAEALRNCLTLIEALYADSGGTEGLGTYEKAAEALAAHSREQGEETASSEKLRHRILVCCP